MSVPFVYATRHGPLTLTPLGEVPRVAFDDDFPFQPVIHAVVDGAEILDMLTQGEVFELMEAWQEFSGVSFGEIRGLIELIEDHGRALESDLIERGLRVRYVGEPWFTWGDLTAVVRWLPRDSALVRSMHPELDGWGVTEYELADVVDCLRLLVWMKTKDGSKGRNRPEPYPRPGVEREGVKKRKGTAVPMDQVRARLAKAGVKRETAPTPN